LVNVQYVKTNRNIEAKQVVNIGSSIVTFILAESRGQPDLQEPTLSFVMKKSAPPKQIPRVILEDSTPAFTAESIYHVYLVSNSSVLGDHFLWSGYLHAAWGGLMRIFFWY
jgi:hypothetical protein